MEAFDGCVLDGSIHALDLPVGPGMSGLGEAMVDILSGAGDVERMFPEGPLVFDHLLDVRNRPAFPGGVGEVRTVISSTATTFPGRICLHCGFSQERDYCEGDLRRRICRLGREMGERSR